MTCVRSSAKDLRIVAYNMCTTWVTIKVHGQENQIWDHLNDEIIWFAQLDYSCI